MKEVREVSEQMQKRLVNRRDILHALHQSAPLSRSALAARCGIRKSSITGIVAELLAQGLLKETEPGRLRSQLVLNPEGAHVVCAFIEGTNLYTCRINLAGEISDRADIPLASTRPQEVLPVLAAEFTRLRGAGSLGFTLAFCGITDHAQQRVVASARLGSWNNFPFVEEFSRLCDTRVWLVNDVYSQMLCHNWFTERGGLRGSALYISVDRGIACRLTVDGAEMCGDGGEAGEIGHIRAGDEGRKCGCGRIDCLETYCSVPAFARAVNELISGGEIAGEAAALSAAAVTDQRVRNVIEREIHRLAGVLVPVLAAVAPRRVLLATADQGFSSLIAGRLHNELSMELAGIFSRGAEIAVAGPVSESTLRGAAVLPIRGLFNGTVSV